MKFRSSIVGVFLVFLITQCGSSSQHSSPSFTTSNSATMAHTLSEPNNAVASPSVTTSSSVTVANTLPKPNSAVISSSFTPHSSRTVTNTPSEPNNAVVSPSFTSYSSLNLASFSPENNTAIAVMNTISNPNKTAVATSSNSSLSTVNVSGNVSLVNGTPGVKNMSSGATNVTAGVNVSSELTNISTTLQSMWVGPTVSITSRISGDTSTYNNTFFIEFKMSASHWSPALMTKHNYYINKANSITTKIGQMYMNDSTYEGSYVLGFRKGIYVSIKVKFKPQADLSSLDALIAFLRSGGEKFRTDKVFIKLSQHANCIINYEDTKVCDCQSMMYKRQITCQQPDVFGGVACPEKCQTGDIILGTSACSWDDLDAYGCPAYSARPLVFLLVFSLLVNFWNISC